MKSYAKKIGLAPGSLVHIGDKKSIPTQISVLDTTTLEFRPLSSPDELNQIKASETINWINITGLNDIKAIDEVGQLFDIHPLVLEDILHTSQRPKVQFFEDYIFIVLKMIHLKQEDEDLDIDQVSIILTKNTVITFFEQEESVLDPLKKRIQKSKGYYYNNGSDFLAYSIMDVIVDHYFLIIETISDVIEDLETDVIESKSKYVSSDIHSVKRDLLHLRKATWPLREAISTLIRDKHVLIQERLSPFLHDLYDHTIQVIDAAETARDMTSGLVEIYLSSISIRMNEVMKTLTVIATIFIPLTFIVGVYGMNFENMPELTWHWGYFYLWGFMLAIAISMLIYFKIKRWF